MPLIFRYIFGSVLMTSLAALGLFVFVFLAGNVIKEVLEIFADGRGSPLLFVQLVALLIPYVFSFALPLGVLSGILMVLGRLSAQREIVACKAAGISLWKISLPIFFVALIGVGSAYMINHYYAPTARAQFKVIGKSLENDPLALIAPRKFIKEYPGMVIYIGSKQGKRLQDFWIWELDDKKRAMRLLRAREGIFEYEPESQSMLLTLKNATAELRDASTPDDLSKVQPIARLGDTVIRMPLDQLFGSRGSEKRLSNMGLGELKQEYQTAEAERQTALAEGRSEQVQLAEQRMHTINMTIQRNSAMAFSVLALTCVGLPLSIQAGRKENFANVALALGLALSHYFAMVTVSMVENRTELQPELLIWLPNLLFLGIGGFLLYKANRH